MHPTIQRFIEVLEEDIKNWEDAAKACETVIPHLVGDDQKEQWRARGQSYRAQAQSHRMLIALVKAEEAGKQ